MILVLGEILFDIFSDGNRLGGAPFNFAFHLKSLGFDVRFISRIGRDDLGREILDFLGENGFDTGDIQQDPDHATGTVHITMHSDGSHDFVIETNTAYDHIVYDNRLERLCRNDWELFYVGSLIQRTRNNASLVQKILTHKSHRSVLFCDINLRPECYTSETIEACLNLADILKINQEELDEIIKDKNYGVTLDEKVKYLIAEYSINDVILTRGARGSQWFLSDGTGMKSQITDAAAIILDTVGAGDAYAAMAVAGQMRGLSPIVVMDLAGEFARFVCSIKGAIPEDISIYREFKRRLKL